ncbi:MULTISPECIES: hypothetical protein [unclassified Cyanobium]|uniref:hypothetical protein n=1 Tax=unclassified Cyanobium TaxID=2627006 RepID=UPI0020CF66C5|nr:MULTISPECIES: hypothetical protein [unclassified Cyanobium]MCP9857747.1 hypothetical protein [Cyanobium sp. Cruz-8H5]MCP9865195.1 hypothetical protein [Cyanobium sp. Cruz-8D1]
MTALLDRIVGVIAGFQSREASLRQQLAEALADDAADDAAIAAAQRDALTAMERASTAEALMAQLQASAKDADTELQAIRAYTDQFVPPLTDQPQSTALPGGDTAAVPAEPVVVAGDSDGADEPEPSAVAGDPALGLGAADPEASSSRDQPPAA